MHIHRLAPAALCLALAYLVPEHYLPWDTFQQQALALAALLACTAAALWPAAGSSPAPARWHWPWVAAVPALLALTPWLQWAAGSVAYLSDALLPSLLLLALALAIGTGARWAALDATALLRCLALALLLAGVLSSAIALAQWLQLHGLPLTVQMPPGTRAGGNLAQPNHLATLLVMAMAMVVLCFERRWLGGPVCAALAAMLGLGLACALSRTGFLSALGLGVLMLAGRRRFGLRLPAPAACVWMAAVVALALGSDSLASALGLDRGLLDERARVGTRPILWAVMWDAIQLSPWLGHGWNQVAMAQQLTAHLHPAADGIIQNSHNAVLDLWVWVGVPLGSAVVLGVAWWFFSRWARARTATNTCLLAAITAVLAHAMLEYPLEYAYFLVPLGLCMGLLDGGAGHAARPGQAAAGGAPAAQPARASQAQPRPGLGLATPAGVPALGLALGLALGTWVAAEYLQVEDSFRSARVGLLGFNQRVDIVPPPPVRLLDGPREYHWLMITQARAGMAPQELQRMQRAATRYPFPPAQMRWALAAGLNGQPQQASRTLRGLCAVHGTLRCAEARSGWAAAQRAHPALRAVDFPPVAR